MPLKNFSTVGKLQGYEYLRGTISKVDHTTDTCDISAYEKVATGNGWEYQLVSYTDVPIFYHCKADKAERGNGAIIGGSWAFADGDEVVILRQRPGFEDKIFVIGHTSGARRCAPALMIYSTQSGEEAVVWDLINDSALTEFGDNYTDIAAALTAAGVTEQTECVMDETKWACSYSTYFQFKRTDCPTTLMALANDFVYEPFRSGSSVNRWTGTSISGPGYSSSGGECTSGSGYGVPYLFFTNPHPIETPTGAIPGPWTAYITGELYEKVYTSGVESPGKWNESAWGEMPYPEDQLYYTNPDNGWVHNRGAIPITYLYFRSMFDYKFDYGQVPPTGSAVTVLTIPALNMASTEMFISARDGSIRLLSDISESIWLEMNMSQASYNDMVSIDNTYMNPNPASGMVAMHPYFNMPYMIDKADGLATNDKTSLFFEYCGVYPDAYEFYEDGQVWDEEKTAKLKQELRIYFRHPYPLKNTDAVIFKLVNDERETLGLKKLEWNWNLYQAAQRFSDDVASRKALEPAHIGSDGSTAVERIYDSYYKRTYNTRPESVGGVPLSPARTAVVGENVGMNPFGFNCPVEYMVDTEGVSEVESHTTNGAIVKTVPWGWRQSPGHWDNIIYPGYRETAIATQKGNDGFYYASQELGAIGDETIFWPGFSWLNPEKLINYVNENFTFYKHEDDTRRKPRIYLCTIPQD